jgi:hypothetical protein
MEYGFEIAKPPRIVDASSPTWDAGGLARVTVAAEARTRPQQPLLFMDDATVKPHHLPNGAPISASHDPNAPTFMTPALHCYFAQGFTVSGNGLLWIGNELLILDDIMPEYWRDLLSGKSPQSTPETDVRLPVRTISGPCVSGLGWGGQIYGHVLLEILPKIIAAFEVMKNEPRPRLLLRNDTPDWALSMLKAAGIKKDDIERFDPTSERVKLEQGIFPANLGTTHPYLEKVFSSIDPSFKAPERYGIYYLSRASFRHRRGCINEGALEAIAEKEFGAEIVRPEELPWLEQVRLFRSAKAVVGLTGSALHTALVSDGGLTVGSIGVINRVQSAIATLRGQRMAYQVGFPLSNSYEVPEKQFREMMTAIYRYTEKTEANVA